MALYLDTDCFIPDSTWLSPDSSYNQQMAIQVQDIETKEMAERLEKTVRREKTLVTNVRKYEGMMTEYSKVIQQVCVCPFLLYYTTHSIS